MSMKLILQRRSASVDGVFSDLLDEKGNFLFCALEHAYLMPKKKIYKAKIPVGTYTCKKTYRTLTENPTEADYFWTYEIMNVKGHTGILFHVGNYNDDSNGCVLIGKGLGRKSDGGRMITSSRQAMEAFMKLLDGAESFTLVVERTGA
jgi:hypothetical protein